MVIIFSKILIALVVTMLVNILIFRNIYYIKYILFILFGRKHEDKINKIINFSIKKDIYFKILFLFIFIFVLNKLF